MDQGQEVRTSRKERIDGYEKSLVEREVARTTAKKYVREACRLEDYLEKQGRELGKQALLSYKETLVARYAPSSVNVAVAAINGYLAYLGHPELRLRQLKVQQDGMRAVGLELTRSEYRRLVDAARRSGDEGLALLLQTICSTGIRVSELEFITVEAVRNGWAQVTNKGRSRKVWLPTKLQRLLGDYADEQGLVSGPVFVSRTGRPLDRTRVWRMLKGLAADAGVDERKVFPHNLRHLFAQTFYQQHHDMDALSAVLGHSSVETTRIYLARDESARYRQVNSLNLVA